MSIFGPHAALVRPPSDEEVYDAAVEAAARKMGCDVETLRKQRLDVLEACEGVIFKFLFSEEEAPETVNVGTLTNLAVATLALSGAYLPFAHDISAAVSPYADSMAQSLPVALTYPGRSPWFTTRYGAPVTSYEPPTNSTDLEQARAAWEKTVSGNKSTVYADYSVSMSQSLIIAAAESNVFLARDDIDTIEVLTKDLNWLHRAVFYWVGGEEVANRTMDNEVVNAVIRPMYDCPLREVLKIATLEKIANKTATIASPEKLAKRLHALPRSAGTGENLAMQYYDRNSILVLAMHLRLNVLSYVAGNSMAEGATYADKKMATLLQIATRFVFSMEGKPCTFDVAHALVEFFPSDYAQALFKQAGWKENGLFPGKDVIAVFIKLFTEHTRFVVFRNFTGLDTGTTEYFSPKEFSEMTLGEGDVVWALNTNHFGVEMKENRVLRLGGVVGQDPENVHHEIKDLTLHNGTAVLRTPLTRRTSCVDLKSVVYASAGTITTYGIMSPGKYGSVVSDFWKSFTVALVGRRLPEIASWMYRNPMQSTQITTDVMFILAKPAVYVYEQCTAVKMPEIFNTVLRAVCKMKPKCMRDGKIPEHLMIYVKLFALCLFTGASQSLPQSKWFFWVPTVTPTVAHAVIYRQTGVYSMARTAGHVLNFFADVFHGAPLKNGDEVMYGIYTYEVNNIGKDDRYGQVKIKRKNGRDLIWVRISHVVRTPVSFERGIEMLGDVLIKRKGD